MLKDYCLKPLSGGTPDSAVIFLHGLGDSGSGGLLEVCRIWQRQLPGCEFLCPDAPFPFDMMPLEFGGRQWFSLLDRTEAVVRAGVLAAVPLLNAYIDHVLATRQLTPDRLALAGFSQGTMMALYTALRRPQPVACILGYSGLLADGEKLGAEIKAKPPVLLVHGRLDETLPFTHLVEAERQLQANGVPVTVLERPALGHSIDEAGVEAGMAFLLKNLN